MKHQLLLAAALSLFLLTACTKPTTQDDIAPCNNQSEYIASMPSQTTLLLRDSIGLQTVADSDYTSYLLCYTTSSDAVFVDNVNKVFYLICNFPDFARAWDIPSAGLTVRFSGNRYVYDRPTIEPPMTSYYLFELTELSKP